jgi:hypothetical protein
VIRKIASGSANFYEKALFVKVDLATALWWMQRLSVPFALCFYPHFRGAHFGSSVHRMGSVLIRALPRRCDLLSGLPGRVDQVRSRSRLQRSEAPSANNGRGHQPPWRRLAALWRYLHLLRARLCSIASLFKLPPPALGADACCGADRIPLP